MINDIITLQESLRALNREYLEIYNSTRQKHPYAKREEINELLFNKQLEVKANALESLLSLRRALSKESTLSHDKIIEAIDILIDDYKFITNDKNALGVNNTFSWIEQNITRLTA